MSAERELDDFFVILDTIPQRFLFHTCTPLISEVHAWEKKRLLVESVNWFETDIVCNNVPNLKLTLKIWFEVRI